MKKRILGKHGPELSVIGLGAWAIGGSWEFGWGPVDDKESIRTIHHALDLGINWIDTAAVYGLGHSEEIVGQALRGIRTEVFLATKCGMVWDERRVVTKNLKPESIRKEVTDSLRRLGTDYIDLYQFHWPDDNTPVEESWKVMADLVREGKVRYIGLCNHGPEALDQCRAIAPVQSLQPPYNLLKRDAERELLPYCAKHDIGVVAYSPMASGLLTDKFDFGSLAEDDWRRKSPRFGESARVNVGNLLKELRPIAAKYNLGISQLAIAWVLKNPAITSAIVGARKRWQIEETSSAAEVTLSSSDTEMIESLIKNF